MHNSRGRPGLVMAFGMVLWRYPPSFLNIGGDLKLPSLHERGVAIGVRSIAPCRRCDEMIQYPQPHSPLLDVVMCGWKSIS